MDTTVYIISAVLVFFSQGCWQWPGFLFVPLFYYLGVPLVEATPTALLLNTVSLLFAAINYWRGGLINWRVGLPVLITAVILSPLGAQLTPSVDKTVLLAMFAVFLVFAGAMMLFYKAKPHKLPISRNVEIGAGTAVGGTAGFLGGLLGVGGGNFILPVLNWLGLDTKVAAGTTALVVVFSSFSGFLGHATMGNIDPLFIGLTAVMAAAGSVVGSHLMKTKLSSTQLKYSDPQSQDQKLDEIRWIIGPPVCRNGSWLGCWVRAAWCMSERTRKWVSSKAYNSCRTPTGTIAFKALPNSIIHGQSRLSRPGPAKFPGPCQP